MNGEESPTAADLFCGVGGAGRGLESAGFEVLAGVDQKRAPLQSYNESLEAEPILHDLGDFRGGDRILSLDVDYVHGSPPCQGFSQARGERDPNAEKNALVWKFIEWVEALSPKVVTMENVAGMATISSTWMDRVEGAFRDAWYRTKWKLLNAANYGVPQTRRRIFVIGIREDMTIPSRWFPEPTHAEAATTTLDGRQLEEWRTARQAIGDLAEGIAADGGQLLCSQNLKHIKEGRRSAQSLSEPSKTVRSRPHYVAPPNHDPQEHRKETRERFAQMPLGKTDGSVNESRLAPDEPSRTIVSGNGTPPVNYSGEEPSEVRRLTVRECARLQSFPDEHVFVGGKEEQYRQVGNAVPPRLQHHIARHLRDVVLNEN